MLLNKIEQNQREENVERESEAAAGREKETKEQVESSSCGAVDGSDGASDTAGMLICWHAQEEESKGVARRTMAEKVWDWGQNEDKQFMRATRTPPLRPCPCSRLPEGGGPGQMHYEGEMNTFTVPTC